MNIFCKMSDEEAVSCICNYMKSILECYNTIRGKNIDFTTDLFWDAVIISASDAFQKMSYEMQIKQKRERAELPTNVPFHVFNDPPGYKIGCGGSAMYVLKKIEEIYGNAMYDMRFLFLPAGGYSQRLPNLSVLGKLFSPLPFGDVSYQMLDLILATYLPFLKHMKPGVFLASSDAIISFYLDDSVSWTFENEGFTALAHPSSLFIGTGHGVYVLPPKDDVGSRSCFMSDCLRVLQKPTIEEMHEKGAVFKSTFGEETEDVVFSDSAFFFDHEITKKLINFYKIFKPLKCELSSYGDFLQPLGLLASPSYIVDKVTSEDLATVRSALYRELYGIRLSVLVLKNSNFHHLGSMKEYIESLCFKNKLSSAFPLSRISFSLFSVNSMIPLYIKGTIVHSIIHPLSHIPEATVVEYCNFNVAVDVGKNCIISNAQLNGFSVQRLPVTIPDNTLLHTLPLKDGYVSIAFGIDDDIKKRVKSKDFLEIQFFGKKLKAFANSDDKIFDTDCCHFSLWTAKLFPVCPTAEESLKRTLEIILYLNDREMSYHHFSSSKSIAKWVSMHDILLLKDTEKMINYQKELYERILSGKKSN